MEEKHFFSLGAVLPTTPYDLHKTRIFSGDKKDGENQTLGLVNYYQQGLKRYISGLVSIWQQK